MMTRKWFRVNKSDITLIQFIIEGYEGLATVSTMDAEEVIIQILIMPDFNDDMKAILYDLKNRFLMEEIDPHLDQVIIC